METISDTTETLEFSTRFVQTPFSNALSLEELSSFHCAFELPKRISQPRLRPRMRQDGAGVWGRHYDSTHASIPGCQGNCGRGCSFVVVSHKGLLT